MKLYSLLILLLLAFVTVVLSQEGADGTGEVASEIEMDGTPDEVEELFTEETQGAEEPYTEEPVVEEEEKVSGALHCRGISCPVHRLIRLFSTKCAGG
jgi:hypothetical protein